MVPVTLCGQWRLAGMPQPIASPANGRDVGSSIGTAILAGSEMFRGALDMPYLTNAHSVQAGKF
jgi:hypothetical protein